MGSEKFIVTGTNARKCVRTYQCMVCLQTKHFSLHIEYQTIVFMYPMLFGIYLFNFSSYLIKINLYNVL